MIPATAPTSGGIRQRRRFTVTGVVQGVGFRPFVHRVAVELGLSGFVGNDSAAVFIEAQGPATALDKLGQRIRCESPPMAVISDVSYTQIAQTPFGDSGFHIADSTPTDAAPTPIPPDIAVCDDCIADLFDPTNRRYRHPFVTCTNCGPRFTIVRGLPYDRPATTMAGFPMCRQCSAEYGEQSNRRFHAQPIACPDCGPSMWFAGDGVRIDDVDAALDAGQTALAEGRILAIKGIGGYHLACGTVSDTAIAALRQRKGRRGKPFAVLVRNLDVARQFAEINAADAAALTSPARPVVLLRRRRDAPVASGVAPGSPLIGLMLPYTPIHHLLLAQIPDAKTTPLDAVVLTSANRSDEPICYTDDDAALRLPVLADAIIDHDRPIHVPCDDSVVRPYRDGNTFCEIPIRRSRGYAPLPVDLGRDSPPVLAVGGELKNTFCLTDGRRAYCSAHIGDMGSVATLRAFTRSVRQLCEIRGLPSRLAADLHPRYASRNWAEHNAGDRYVDLIQHHHAHVVSLLAEHQMLGEPVIGIAFDGTGFGCDETVWGGEILRLGRDTHRFSRVGHLAAVPLAGGDAAVRNPWRVALAHLWHARVPWAPELPPVSAATPAELRLLRTQFATNQGCVATTSIGRLFDSVASLLGVRQNIDYEGQAAIELEVLAGSADDTVKIPLRLAVDRSGVMDPAPMIVAMVQALRNGADRADVALAFHHAVAHAVSDVVHLVAGEISTVGLTGGVFQNVLLLQSCTRLLQRAGYTVLTHRVVPPNDGGLALGQAAISALTALDEADRPDERNGRTAGCA